MLMLPSRRQINNLILIMYKFNIVKTTKGFHAQFLYNSTIIFWTENYTSEANALNAIHSIALNAKGSPIGKVGY